MDTNSLPEPKLTDTAITILQSRYLNKDENGKVIETPKEMFIRVAKAAAEKFCDDNSCDSFEMRFKRFYDILINLDFLPNSPALMNAGTSNPQLSACFVIGIEDSMESIFDALKSVALVQKSGGGCIAKGSKVLTYNGQKNIEDVTDEDLVYSLNDKDGKCEWKRVLQTHKYTTEGKKILSVSLGASSNTVVTTDWHPFATLTPQGITYTRADELKEDDLVVSGESVESKFMHENITTNERDWLYGLITADGSFDTTSSRAYRRLRITKSNEAIIQRASAILGVTYRAFSRNGGSTTYEVAKVGSEADKIYKDFYAGETLNCYSKKIPTIYLNSSIESKIMYLAGLLDGDGYYNKEKNTYEYDTVSIKLFNDLRGILSELGIAFKHRIKVNNRENEVPLFNISMPATYGTLYAIIRNTVRFSWDWEAHKHNAIEFPNSYKEIFGFTGRCDRCAVPFKEHVVRLQQWNQSGLINKDTLLFILNNIEYADTCTEIYRRLAAGAQKVIGVTEGSCEELYDLTVEDNNNYLASTTGQMFIIHNTGLNFSTLRPANDFVKTTTGVSSGPISFMKVFNSATDVIKQGGRRRGASMGVLRVDHPDIEDFISCKDKEGEISNFNISVAITDKFMKAVKEDGDFDLVNPKNNKVVKTVKAKDLFSKITEHAWKNGEPGVLFIDNANIGNRTPFLGKLETTNPCVTGDTLLLTSEGYKPIETLVGKPVMAWNGDMWSEVIPQVTGENQPLLKVTINDGTEIKCTPYHKFLINKRVNGYSWYKRVEAAKLKPEMELYGYDYPIIDRGTESILNAYQLGFFAGDGHFSGGRPYIYFYGEKQELIDKKFNGYVYNVRRADRRTYTTLIPEYFWDKFYVPTLNIKLIDRLNWLAGLMDSDGTISPTGNISITSIHKDFLMNIKYMLNTMGVNPKINLMTPAQFAMLPDGHGGQKEYFKQDCYRLNLSPNMVVRLKSLGLRTYRLDLRKAIPNRSSAPARVKSVEVLAEIADKVYCANEPMNNTLCFNSIITGNCGEAFLYPFEACNLGSINLSNMYDPEKGKFTFGIDTEKLFHTAWVAVDFLDSLIDASVFPLDKITENVKKTRKIGLGVMGFADFLLKAGIPYGSEEAEKIVNEIMRTIQVATLSAEEHLIKTRGSSPAFEAEGIEWRNAVLTTIAPTGTIGMLANCSAGCEPIFGIAYKKTGVLDGKTTLWQVNEAFEKLIENEPTEEKEKMFTAISENSGKLPNWIKEKYNLGNVYNTALEIPWEWHIRIQAAFQKYVENAVSKTINMPFEATVEDVKNAYMTAWKTKCKGITIYRSGSRAIEVIKTDKKEDDKMVIAPTFDRPECLEGKTTRVKTAAGTLFVTLNFADGKPYEVFAQIGKAGSDIMAMTEGIARLLSMSLQAGVSIEKAIEQLDGIGGNGHTGFGAAKVRSVPDGLSRGLKRIILHEEAEEPIVEEQSTPVARVTIDICPECGESSLVRESGCEHCNSCGYSRC